MTKNPISKLWVIVFIAIVFCNWGCEECEDKYYLHLDWPNNKYELLGKYEISEQEANSLSYYTFSYDKKSCKLEKIEFFKKGNPCRDPNLDVHKIQLQHGNGYEEWHYYDECGKRIENNSNIFANRIMFNNKDERTELINYGNSKRMKKDPNGVERYFLELSNNGQRLRSIRLNETGKKIDDNFGNRNLDYLEDANGFVIEEINFEDNGQRLKNRGGWASARYVYDTKGNKIEAKYFDIAKNLISIRKYEYDQYGYETEVNYLDKNGNLRDVYLSRSIFGDNLYYSTKKIIYSDIGEKQSVIYLDKNGVVIDQYTFNSNNTCCDGEDALSNKNM